jgi:hypothetical protein
VNQIITQLQNKAKKINPRKKDKRITTHKKKEEGKEGRKASRKERETLENCVPTICGIWGLYKEASDYVRTQGIEEAYDKGECKKELIDKLNEAEKKEEKKKKK